MDSSESEDRYEGYEVDGDESDDAWTDVSSSNDEDDDEEYWDTDSQIGKDIYYWTELKRCGKALRSM